MSSQVRKCGESCPPANLSDLITCNFCELKFHLKCYGVNKTCAKSVADCSNIQFLCDACLENLVARKEVVVGIAELKTIMLDVQTTVNKSSKPACNDVTGSMAELKEVVLNIQSSVNSAARPTFAGILAGNTPVSSNADVSVKKRRRIDERSDAASTAIIDPVAKPTAIVGTNEASGIVSVEQRKFVVVSQLNPATTSVQLVEFVNKGLGLPVDSPLFRANPLIRKDTDVSTLDYISFKLHVPVSYYDSILSPNLWPRGVTVRDFVTHNNRNNRRAIGHFLEPTVQLME